MKNHRCTQINFAHFTLVLVCACLPVGVAWASTPVLQTPRADENFYVGMPFTLDFEISSDDEAGEDPLLFRPPVLPDLNWAAVSAGPLTMSRGDTRNHWRYSLEITPKQEGAFTLPALTFMYAPALSLNIAGGALSDEALASEAWQALTSEPVDLVVHEPVSAWIIALPVLGVLVAALACIWFCWWRRGVEAEDTTISPVQWAQQALHQAQRQKLDGDFYALYQGLVQVMDRVGDAEADKPLIARLNDTVSAVGFQGKRPTDDELSGDIRDVERVITRLKEESRE